MHKKTDIILLIGFILISGCNIQYKDENNNNCPLPPETFTERDLIGTWKTGLSIDNDTLILKENGTYKQIIHVQTPSFDYESEWLPWSMEISDIGIPYLHLEGMRLCVYWEGVECQTSGGGDDEWYDFCEKEWVQMPGEGILMVLGPPEGMELPSPSISLFALQRSTDGATGYTLQEE